MTIIVHSIKKNTYTKTHKTTYIELYTGNIFAIAHITVTYKIGEHLIGVIVAVIRAIYGLAAKCGGDMGHVWVERRNNTHTLPITRQL